HTTLFRSRHDAGRIDDRSLDGAAGADAYVRENDGALHVTALIDAHVREQQRLIDVRARNDAAARDDGVHGHAATAVLVQDELRRRILALIGPDRPLLVIDIELRIDVHELHVRLIEGVDRTHVAPIALHARLHVGKRIGKYFERAQRFGNDVAP